MHGLGASSSYPAAVSCVSLCKVMVRSESVIRRKEPSGSNMRMARDEESGEMDDAWVRCVFELSRGRVLCESVQSNGEKRVSNTKEGPAGSNMGLAKADESDEKEHYSKTLGWVQVCPLKYGLVIYLYPYSGS